MMEGTMGLIIAGIIGVVVGAVLMYVMKGKQPADQSVKAVEEKLNNYQQEVESHFAKTADLIDNLTNSYKEVFEHLSDSAESLLTEEQIKNQLINRKSREVTIKYLKSTSAEDEINPPDPV